MFLLSNLLGTYDMISYKGVMYTTIVGETQIEIKPLVFGVRDGYIVHSRDKYYWSKSTIKPYLDKYIIKGMIGYKPLKHSMKEVCTLPAGIGTAIKEILQEHSISQFNSSILFSSEDRSWYLFTISGVITGPYFGASTFAMPTNYIVTYSDYQVLSVIKDLDFVGIQYSDNLFEYKIYNTEAEPEPMNYYNTVHYKTIKKNRDYRDTGETVKYGRYKFREMLSIDGVKYSNKDITFYRFAIL